MNPPPYATHVDIEASAGSLPWSIASPASPEPNQHPTLLTSLLNPSRGRAASLGRVDWYGLHGQLVLAPTGPGGGGEEAGLQTAYGQAQPVVVKLDQPKAAGRSRLY